MCQHRLCPPILSSVFVCEMSAMQDGIAFLYSDYKIVEAFYVSTQPEAVSLCRCILWSAVRPLVVKPIECCLVCRRSVYVVEPVVANLLLQGACSQLFASAVGKSYWMVSTLPAFHWRDFVPACPSFHRIQCCSLAASGSTWIPVARWKTQSSGTCWGLLSCSSLCGVYLTSWKQLWQTPGKVSASVRSSCFVWHARCCDSVGYWSWTRQRRPSTLRLTVSYMTLCRNNWLTAQCSL